MGKIKETGNVIKAYKSRKSLIICDREMLRLGYTHEVINSLLAKGIKYELYANVSNSLDQHQLDQCIELAQINGVDSIVAIGDGGVCDFVDALDEQCRIHYPKHEIIMTSNVN